MRITLPSGTAAELALPPGVDPDAPRAQGLVVIPDVFGLRPLFDDLCASLAERTGWVVCAPELFPGHEDASLEERFALMRTKRDDDVLGDAVAAADATGAARVCVTGFCMGGMYTLKAVGTGRFAAAAGFYGMIRVPEAWAGPGQGEPLEAVTSAVACPALAIVGTNDPYTPADDLDALEAAGVTVVRYEGAEHGFVHDPSRPTHRADDAADAWNRVLAFLAG